MVWSEEDDHSPSSADAGCCSSLAPRNHMIINYCTKLVNCNFFGHTSLAKQNDDDDHNNFSLPDILRATDAFLRSFKAGVRVQIDNENLLTCLRALMAARKITSEQEFMRDATVFLNIYNERGGKSMQCKCADYWGSQQQLMAGKIIADFVGEELGPLDPVFGVLLNPSAGHDDPIPEWLRYYGLISDDTYKETSLYHWATHAAFGYLRNVHQIGPGFNYLGGWCSCCTDKQTCGHFSSIRFWSVTLNRLGAKTKETIF